MVKHEIILNFDGKTLLETLNKGRGNTDHECFIESRVFDETCVVLDIQGIFDGAHEEVFAREFLHNIGKYKKFIINFSDLTHIDPSGAGLLVSYASLAARKNVYLVGCGIKGPFRELFRLTSLDATIPLFENDREAHQFLSEKKSIAPLPDRMSTYEGPPVKGWARAVDRLSIRDIPAEAMNINVDGRETTSPVAGFGSLWDKRYILRLENSTLEPHQIISVWRSEFPRFWPAGNRLFPSGKASIAPGTSAVINLALPGGIVLATGVMVIYADETSFSFTTIQGHILSGWVTFSSFKHNGSTYIQVNPLFRASDPLMELSMRMGASRQEDIFWHSTLNNLAQYLGLRGEIAQRNVLIDPHF